jgi:hypothetical protein
MNKLLIIISCLFLFLLYGCSDTARAPGNEVIASVAGKQLTLEQALNEIPSFVLHQDTLSAVYSFANRWVEQQVAIGHARQIGIDQTPDFQEKINRYHEQLLQSMLKEYVLQEHQDEIEVTSEEAQEYYQTHRDQFVFDENYVRVRYLTTRTRTEAENANRDLAGGRDWEEIVEQYSIDPEFQFGNLPSFIPFQWHWLILRRFISNYKIWGLPNGQPFILQRAVSFCPINEEKPKENILISIG